MLKKIIKKIKFIFYSSYKNYRNFGFFFAHSYFWGCIFKKKMPKNRLKAIKILDNKYGNLIESIKDDKYFVPFMDEKQKNIFIFWAQGFENAPILVKEVVQSIEKFYYDYNIIKIDLSNYDKIVDIDDNIIRKFNNNEITIQTFSDILRFNLLYKIGGIWMDATLISFDRLDLFYEIQKNGFFSINHDSIQKQKLWGKVYPVTYTTFFLGSHKDSEIMAACVKLYEEYYKDFDYAIDYFMNDYFLILCMKHNLCNGAMNKIPFNLGNPFIFNEWLNEKRKEIDVSEIKKCPQKCNWRNFNVDKYSIFKNGNNENFNCKS